MLSWLQDFNSLCSDIKSGVLRYVKSKSLCFTFSSEKIWQIILLEKWNNFKRNSWYIIVFRCREDKINVNEFWWVLGIILILLSLARALNHDILLCSWHFNSIWCLFYLIMEEIYIRYYIIKYWEWDGLGISLKCCVIYCGILVEFYIRFVNVCRF